MCVSLGYVVEKSGVCVCVCTCEYVYILYMYAPTCMCVCVRVPGTCTTYRLRHKDIMNLCSHAGVYIYIYIEHTI